MNFVVVSSRTPTGPRACTREVEIPISAPRPNWLPSTSRVEALTSTAAASTSRVKRRARPRSLVTMVSATHSSSHGAPDAPIYGGTESGYMIAGEGKTIYVSGDTDVMADMAVFEDLHHPEIGILCAGGHFTMDMRRAAYAARKFFNFKVVIPCHYRTFPLLEQSAEALAAELPGVRVIEPQVLEPIEL